MADVVYALHTFDAENEDELTFQAGERIIVLERDDQYSDGWYQGRNERGEIGLFPQSYTSSRPPSLAEEQADPSAHDGKGDTAASTPKATSGATLGPVPLVPVTALAHTPTPPATTSLTPPDAERRDSISEASLHSHFTEEEDEDEDGVAQNRQRLSDGAAHRAALAAKVSQNAEREAQEARDLAERRKREDEERYAQSAGQTGLIDGLQLSDESDDDGADEPVESFLPLPAPLPDTSTANGDHQAAAEAPILHEDHSRPRADTDTSTYDESALAAAPVPATENVAEPSSRVPLVAGERDPHVVEAEASALPPSVGDLRDVDEAPRSGEQTPTSHVATTHNGTDQQNAATALSVAGAGLAGAFGAAAAQTASPPSPAPQPERDVGGLSDSISSSYSAQQALAESSDPPPPSNRQPTHSTVEHAPAFASDAPPSIVPSALLPNASPPRSNVPRVSSPLVVDTMHSPQLGANSASPATDSALSPGSAIRGVASPIVRWDSLPADPVDWSVENVVDWGQQKGFDENILSKFAEHEITGDVLLEMDVAMLKEIDLVAFGRRVRVYNAIKELRQRTQPGNLMSSMSTSGGFLSPGMNGSGFESPTTPAFSPAIGQVQPVTATQSDVPLAGLGLPDDVTPQAPSGEVGYPRSDQLDATTSMASLPSQYPSPAAVLPLQSALRNEVVGSDAPSQVPEQSRLSSAASSLRPRSARRGRQSDELATGTATALTGTEAVAVQDSKGSKGEKAGFFETLPSLPVPGRNRKPPPRVPSALLIDSDGAVGRPRPRTTLQDRAKRSTRLFSSFGGSSGSDKSPTTGQSVRSRASNSTIAVGRDAPTAMSVKSVDPVPRAMVREKGVKVTDGNLLDKIGRPDYSGWMRKKGEQYNTWKMRFFVLKGTYLYYLKSEAEQRAKGVIDLTGYRVISDPDIRPGEYAFKITHDTQRTHYFAAAEQITIRAWMKEILKATIFRDYSALVVSSCDIEVLSLDAAASRSPRPPSPERRAEIQKKRYAGTNPNTLSQKDAAILMELAPGSPYMNGENLYDSVARRPAVAEGGDRKASLTSLEGMNATSGGLPPPVGAIGSELKQVESPRIPSAVVADPKAISGRSDLLSWVNANLPQTCPPASDLSTSLRSGQLIVRLLENLSGKMSGIPDSAFKQFNQDAGSTFDPAYLDTLFSVFDYISPLASTDDVSMEDMLTGNPSRMTLLLERIRANFPGI